MTAQDEIHALMKAVAVVSTPQKGAPVDAKTPLIVEMAERSDRLIAELSALRAVAEAADVLATTAQLAARHMPAGTIADLINDIAKVRAALDRVREGGGG